MSDEIRYEPTWFRRIFVQDRDALVTAVTEFGEADAIGVDLEMVQRVERRSGGLQEWVHVLALIQIASEGMSAIVDPVRCPDLTPLKPLMAGPVRKVFLGGGQDATLLEREGLPARNVVDVGEVALALFGRREDGMAALARRIFGISLDKTVRRADWMARPINPALLTYAHQDAELTLLIYRWFQKRYPEIVAVHERLELEPKIPDSSPVWLREAARRSNSDIRVVVAAQGLDSDRDADSMAEDIREVLLTSTAPRQINRLLRIAGELGLKSLLPEILPLARSRSSLIRASAARAIGTLGKLDSEGALLEELKTDSVEDVKKAAEVGLRDLKMPPVQYVGGLSDDAPSLDEGSLSALQKLMQQLEDRDRLTSSDPNAE